MKDVGEDSVKTPDRNERGDVKTHGGMRGGLPYVGHVGVHYQTDVRTGKLSELRPQQSWRAGANKSGIFPYLSVCLL